MFPRLVVLLSIASLPAYASGEADGDMLEALYADCRTDGAYCRDYSEGVLDGIVIGTTGALIGAGISPQDPQIHDIADKVAGICLPDNGKTEPSADSILSYMDKAKEGAVQMPSSPEMLVWFSFRHAYPCSLLGAQQTTEIQ